MKEVLTLEEANAVSGGCKCDCSCTNKPHHVGPASGITECMTVCENLYGRGVNIGCKRIMKDVQ